MRITDVSLLSCAATPAHMSWSDGLCLEQAFEHIAFLWTRMHRGIDAGVGTKCGLDERTRSLSCSEGHDIEDLTNVTVGFPRPIGERQSG
jgi:hypothetical protein